MDDGQDLITSWTDYAAAAHRMLGRATRTIAIFDHDLSALRLENPAVIASLTGFLRTSPLTSLRIAVQDSRPLLTAHPRLLSLLDTFAHKLHVVETPAHLAALADSLLIVDGDSALVRFHRDHARSKEIVADTVACEPYRRRFDDIWAETGTPVSARSTGL